MDRNTNDMLRGPRHPREADGRGPESESNRKGTPQADGDPGISESRNTPDRSSSVEREERKQLTADPKKKPDQGTPTRIETTRNCAPLSAQPGQKTPRHAS